MVIKVLILSILLLAPSWAWARDHVVSAKAGALGWVISAGHVVSGDRVWLEPGSHGTVSLRGVHFDPPVRVIGHGAHLEHLAIFDSSGLHFVGMSVWPTTPQRGVHMVRAGPKARHIAFTQLDIRASSDAYGYADWSKQDWRINKRPGVLLQGDHLILRGSDLTALSTAVATTGKDVIVAGNRIWGFSADAIRVLGDGSMVRDNQITDCVSIDANHDDAIQAWSRGPDGAVGRGVVRDLQIIGNEIDEGSQDHPLRCQLQGIGLFDGVFENLRLTDNRLRLRAPHGIAVYGARKAAISGNSVAAPDGSHARPWIGVFAHKDGRPSTGVTLHDNLAPRYRGVPAPDLVSGNNRVTRPDLK